MAAKKKLVLQSSDGESFEIEHSVAIQSQLLSQMVEAGCVDDAIPLANVKSKTLKKIIEFCTKHAEIENPISLMEWDAEFVHIDLDSLFDLMTVANYLNIKSLLDLTCQSIANMIKGKSTYEIRRTFKIKSDLSPEEEKKVMEENKWAFD